MGFICNTVNVVKNRKLKKSNDRKMKNEIL